MNEFTPVQFGKYILLDKIATGGMAELYRAKITGVKGFEKLIAIKKILPHLTSEESLISSFIEEAKLAAFLQHPNIVQIYDFGSMEGNYFLAMEYLFGKDLKYVIRKSEQTKNPLKLANALHIVSRVCNGLNYAHNLKDFHGNSLNIIHRDIGPQNVFITYDGQVKVIDFGIAKAANQNTRTQEDLIKGKIAYMSPEQAQGKEIDHRSDIFSIGILLYELITRKRMYVGDTYKIYPKVRNAEFEPPESAGKDLPPVLHQILNRALAKNPDQRYQSADEMAADLDKCISRLSAPPSAKTVSVYMKNILKREADEEERAMRKAASFEHRERPHSATDTKPKDEETQAYETGDVTETPKRKMRLSVALALILMLGLAFYALVAVENPAEILDKGEKIVTSRFFGQPPREKSTATESVNDAQPESVDSRRISSFPDTSPTVPDTPEVKEGKRLIKEERFSEAIAFFEDLLEKDPSLKGRIADPYSRALQGQSVRLEESDPQKAKQLLLKSIETAPGNSTAHYLLGRIYTKDKDYQKAMAAYEKAVELNTDIAGVYFNLGYIYYALKKDYLRAQKMYERTVELSPPFLDEALFNLALAQKKLDKIEESTKNLEMAIRVNPDNKQAKELLERLTRKSSK